ncbi:MAG: guanylate kinase [Erysipelotrichaceae bacterium]|nr:guanylate kinase [Erysipelotrichaceae bacterium]
MSQGLIVVLSGASSVGKGKIADELLKDPDLKLMYSISLTTRPQKEHEVDGEDYYFVSHKQFATALKKKELLEYTSFNGYYYGTPRAQVDFLVEQGKNVLLEVEAQGVGQIKLFKPDALCFFVLPKSFEDLERQIHEIYGDNDASVEMRINKARTEMELAPLWRNTVTNEDIPAAVAEIKAKILEELENRKNNK